jgi:hypothetical protein
MVPHCLPGAAKTSWIVAKLNGGFKQAEDVCLLLSILESGQAQKVQGRRLDSATQPHGSQENSFLSIISHPGEENQPGSAYRRANGGKI